MISVSLSVSRLSNVITPGVSVSVCGFSRCQSLSDGLNGIMLQICYLCYSNFPYYFVATSQCSKSSSNKFCMQVIFLVIECDV